jgi:eukaryotic-like serine/threonine-protein kinase
VTQGALTGFPLVDAPNTLPALSIPLRPIRVVGRYSIYQPFASGGMATVHLAHVAGSAGFSRVVAIKRMKPELAHDQEFATMFHDEASLAARVVHPNVIATLDVIRDEGELMIVMEYVRGLSLKELLERAFAGEISVPLDVALAIMGGVLEGLHAAHRVRGDDGQLLGLVHRDVSPHNVMVGRDGVARIMDFGVAKAVSKLHVTATHEVRGKLSYLPPERILHRPADLRVDVYSAGVVLWEILANRKRFAATTVGEVVDDILNSDPTPLSAENPRIPPALDAILARAMARDPDRRYASAEAMLVDLEGLGAFASKRAVAAWLNEVASEPLSAHEDLTMAIRAQEREKLVPTAVGPVYREERKPSAPPAGSTKGAVPRPALSGGDTEATFLHAELLPDATETYTLVRPSLEPMETEILSVATRETLDTLDEASTTRGSTGEGPGAMAQGRPGLDVAAPRPPAPPRPGASHPGPALPQPLVSQSVPLPPGPPSSRSGGHDPPQPTPSQPSQLGAPRALAPHAPTPHAPTPHAPTPHAPTPHASPILRTQRIDMAAFEPETLTLRMKESGASSPSSTPLQAVLALAKRPDVFTATALGLVVLAVALSTALVVRWLFG